MQSVGQRAIGRVGEKVEERIDVGGLQQAIDVARNALSVIDIAAIRQVQDRLDITKGEFAQLRGLLDQLATAAQAMLDIGNAEDGFEEGQKADTVFHNLEKALISVNVFREWMDKRIHVSWR